MKKFLKEYMVEILFVISSLINGWLLRTLSTGNMWGVTPILGDLCFLLLVCAFGCLLTKKRNLYYFIWTVLVAFVCLINSMYFNEYHDYASFYLIETLFEAFKMPSEAVTDVIEIMDYIYLWQVIFMGIIFYVKRKKNYHKKGFQKNVLVAFICMIVLILSMDSEDIYRLKYVWNKEYVVRNFGVYSYQVKDIVTSLKRVVCKDCGKKEAIEMVTDFKSPLKEENEYTNIFKGKNLILIHGESIQTMFMDDIFDGEQLMPNVSKLAKEGLFFSNFYSQESVGTSSDTEFTLNNSLLPVGLGTTFVNYNNRHYQSLPGILSKEGYYTFSMHGNVCDFWKRDQMYESMGYQHFYCYDDYNLEEKVGLGLSDKSFFLQSVAKMKEFQEIHPQFMATLIMLSNHTPFHTNELVYDYPIGKLEGSKIGSYLKMVHYADEAIGVLMEELDKEGLLENTVIVFYGDHDAKLKVKEYQKYFDKNEPIDFYEYESYTKVPLIIWTKNHEVQGEITKVMGMIDVLPTLGNMFGFESKYAVGHDIFSIEDNIVVFPNGNWITDKMYQNNQMGTNQIWENVDKKYIKEKEDYARKVVEISNNLIQYDLFTK